VRISASCDADHGHGVTAIAGYAACRIRGGTAGDGDAAGARTGPEE
jgi:hypothetical protein